MKEHRGVVIQDQSVGWDLTKIIGTDEDKLCSLLDVAIDVWKEPIDNVRARSVLVTAAEERAQKSQKVRMRNVLGLTAISVVDVVAGNILVGQSFSALALSPIVQLYGPLTAFTVAPYVYYSNYAINAPYRANKKLDRDQEALWDLIQDRGVREYTLSLAALEAAEAYEFFRSNGEIIPPTGQHVFEGMKKNYEAFCYSVDDSPEALQVMGQALLKIYKLTLDSDIPNKVEFMESLKEAINEITFVLAGEKIFRDDLIDVSPRTEPHLGLPSNAPTKSTFSRTSTRQIEPPFRDITRS